MFLFLPLHQAAKLLIGPLTSAIMEDFQINEAQMGAVSSLAIIVAALLYPVRAISTTATLGTSCWGWPP
jgi:hypothetical protein